MHAKLVQSCLTICDPVDCGPPGKNTGEGHHAPLQRVPDPGIEPTSLLFPASAGGFFTTSATWEALLYTALKVEQDPVGFLDMEAFLTSVSCLQGTDFSLQDLP